MKDTIVQFKAPDRANDEDLAEQVVSDVAEVYGLRSKKADGSTNWFDLERLIAILEMADPPAGGSIIGAPISSRLQRRSTSPRSSSKPFRE